MGGDNGIGPVSQLSKIPLVRTTGGEAEPANPPSSVVLSSACTNWRHLVVEEHRFQSPYDLDGLMYLQHVIAINIGRPIICEFKKSGRLQRMCKSKGTICLSPAGPMVGLSTSAFGCPVAGESWASAPRGALI